MKRIIEIRQAEGGQDSAFFVKDLVEAYVRLADRRGWKSHWLTNDGFARIEITGDALHCLDGEAGGHRIQRVPPTERRGRVHTSSVTVVVLDGSIQYDSRLDQRGERDFRVEWFSGSGAGGQHRNKHQNCARLIHIPTGIKKEQQGRSRDDNLRQAREALIQELDRRKHGEAHSYLATTRKDQAGSGQRGDKIRTYRFQDDIVSDHRTGRKGSCARIMRGHFEEVWS